MRHSNISIFVPHIGCPCRCSFCNQNHITSKDSLPTANDVEYSVCVATKSKNYNHKNTQIAFFGGSFTAIDRELMVSYLQTAYRFVESGAVCGIRISTRPDAIDNEVLSLLKKYGVQSIELGAQSMCDDVLLANKRGHTANDIIIASSLIKSYGFELGLQMMTGLYKSDFEKDFYTAQRIAELKPDTVRIYPTVVIKNTLLEQLYSNNEYKPLSVDEACVQGAKILRFFYDNNIDVIRFGLHSVEKDSFIAGPFHPALSEIASSYLYRDIIEKEISKKGFYTVYVNPKELSKAIGQKKSNIKYFQEKGVVLDIKPDNELGKFEIKL